MVTLLQRHAAMGDEELPVTFDHHHPDAVRQMKVAECLAVLQVICRDGMVAEHAHLFRDFHSERLHFRVGFVAEPEPSGGWRERHSLEYKRQQRDEEHYIEYLRRPVESGHDRTQCEEDRTRALETHPGGEGLGLE